MSTCGLVKSLSFQVRKIWHPQVNIKRFRWWKEQRQTPLVRRHGYKDMVKTVGLLPRSKDADRIISMPIYRPKDSWSEKRTLYGQNDYIDILGDGPLKPIDVAYMVPSWLKGFRGNEFQMLLRKRRLFKKGSLPVERPTKWEKMNKRIEWLFYHLNYRSKIS